MSLHRDSPLVTDINESLGSRRDKYKDRREYGAIGYHITGPGPLKRLTERRFARWRRRFAPQDPTLAEIAAAIYMSVMKSGPHYIVYEKQIIQVCNEDLAAWHIGSYASNQYKREDWIRRAHYKARRVDVSWWPRVWGGLPSPLYLAGGKLWGPDRSANGGSVGIEIVWPHDEQRSPPSHTTMQTFKSLVRDISKRREIPLDLYHVLSHSSAHPIARTARGRAWDPPLDVLDQEKLADLLDLPKWTPPSMWDYDRAA